MSGDSPRWRPLPGRADNIPQLLISASFTASSYVVCITDLAHLWTEALGRKAIVGRAINEDTSIDPTEGADQMQELLKRIQAGLDSTVPGHGDTSLRMAQDTIRSRNSSNKGCDSESVEGGFVLVLTCILPKPLKPLRWPIHLSKRPASELVTELVLPLIRSLTDRSRHIETLLDLIRKKDKVINRLVDKLEATGTGLEQVFNPLTGRRKISRADAEKRVSGLATFDEKNERWRASRSEADTGSADVGQLLYNVFGPPDGLGYSSMSDVSGAAELDEWWKKLGVAEDGIVLTERSKANYDNEEAGKDNHTDRRVKMDATNGTMMVDSDATEGEEEEFQIQSTPPHLTSKVSPARRRATPHKAAHSNHVGDSDDDVVIPDSGPEISAPAKSARVAEVDKRFEADEQQVDISDTASEGAESEAQMAAASPKSSQRIGGLGRIGGRPRAAAAEAGPEPGRKRAASSDGEPSDRPPPTKARRVGMIGRKNSSPPSSQPPPASEDADNEVDGAAGNEPPSTPAGNEAAPPPEETEEERADKKRQELQRTMQHKAASAAKKKRKF
jgi:hypothetical protein